jgi:hypothetical protein
MKFRLLLLAATLTGTAALVWAATTPAINLTNTSLDQAIATGQVEKTTGDDGTVTYTRVAPASYYTAPAKAGATVKVNVVFDSYDADGMGGGKLCTPIMPCFFGKDYSMFINRNTKSDTTVVSLPAGTYDLYTEFMLGNTMKAKHRVNNAYVIKPNLVINSDTTVTISFKDATHRVVYLPVYPDGQAMDAYIDTVAAGSKTATRIHNANWIASWCELMFFDANGRNISWTGATNLKMYKMSGGVYTGYDDNATLMSDIDKKYTIAAHFAVLPRDMSDNTAIKPLKDSIYAILIAQNGVTKSDTIANKAANYQDVKTKIAYSKAGKKYPYNGYYVGAMGGFEMGSQLFETSLLSFGINFADNDKGTCPHTLKVCTATDNAPNLTLHMLNRVGDLDYVHVFSERAQQPYFTYTPPIEVVNGEPVAQVYGIDMLSRNIPYKPATWTGNYSSTRIDGNPDFSFALSKMGEAPFCDNVPILVSPTKAQESSGKKSTDFTTVYMGRFGEETGSDLYIAQAKVTRNDSVVYSGPLAFMQSTLNTLSSSGKIDAPYTIEVTDSNRVVDGLEGVNKTTIKFDASKSDWAAPTLSIVQMRDLATGMVTDRFATPSQSNLLAFAGADFRYSKTRFAKSTMTGVKVSYSPYGKNEWTELAVTRDASKTRIQGFGDYYSTTLSTIDNKSANCWYDLKFELTDQAGNSQTQVISPAFKIGTNTSGVNENLATKTVKSVRYYDLLGNESATPVQGVNVKVTTYTDGTTSAIKVMQ